MESTAPSFSVLMGKQDHLRDCAPLLPLYPSQHITFPLLFSACSTMKKLPPSCLNSTPPFSTILIFKHHQKATGLCQGGPTEEAFMQKPGCRLPVQSLLRTNIPGELQSIQQLLPPPTPSPLLLAPAPPLSHANKTVFRTSFVISSQHDMA